MAHETRYLPFLLGIGARSLSIDPQFLPEVQQAIADIDLTPPITVDTDETVEAVILRMRQARHGCVQVMEGERQVGIFTERDVMSRVLRPGLDPGATPVGEVMTPRPMISRIEEPPAHAIHRMVSQGIRHLPINRDGKLAGSISVRSILRYIDRRILGADPAA